MTTTRADSEDAAGRDRAFVLQERLGQLRVQAEFAECARGKLHRLETAIRVAEEGQCRTTRTKEEAALEFLAAGIHHLQPGFRETNRIADPALRDRQLSLAPSGVRSSGCTWAVS